MATTDKDKNFQLKNVLAMVVPQLTSLLMELIISGKLSKASNVDRLKEAVRSLYYELDRIDNTPDSPGTSI